MFDGGEYMLINDVFYLLDNTISEFFPEINKNLLFENRDTFELTKENVVYNLENIDWIINYISLNFSSISKSAIKRYVNESNVLKKSIHEYQLKVARFIINDYNVWSKGYIKIDNRLVYTYIESDYAFRKSISDTLEHLNFSYEIREEAIETFSKNWRYSRMKLQFYNGFAGNITLIARESYTKYDDDFMEKWLKVKEYDYYQKYKDSVDKYGEITPAMLMNNEEAETLKKELIDLSAKRKKEMEFSKENMTNEKKLLMKVLNKI